MKEDAEYLKKILSELAKEMPYKWRVQSFSKQKPQATCVAYIDARDAMDRLDKVCTYGWHREHKEIKGHIYAGIGINMPSGGIIQRWDCGTESNTEAEKGESSDSFKRAAVNFGVGRFLYDLKIQYVDANEKKSGSNYPYVVDGNKRVWDLTEFINSKRPQSKPPAKSPKKEPPFVDRVANAKEIVGEMFVFDCLSSYQYEKAEDVKKEDQAAIMADLLKQAAKGKTVNSQSNRN